MKLSLLLVKIGLLSITNCFSFEENGSGSEDMYIEASGEIEPIWAKVQEHEFSDYELANKEDEIILRGRDSLEIIQPEKFIGPQYLLTRQHSNSSEEKDDMISKVVTDINEFISLFSLPSRSTLKFPIDEVDDTDDICTCECLKKYEYFHSSEEERSTDEVEVVLKQGTGQNPCSEKQYLQCCQPSVNGSPRFRFPESSEISLQELEISESVIHSTNDNVKPSTTEKSVQTLNPLLEEDIYSFVDLLGETEHLNVTVPSMANWFILLDVKTSSSLEFTLTSRSIVGFLAKEGDKPLLKNFDIFDKMDGVNRHPYSTTLTSGSWYFRLTNEENFDQKMLLNISHQTNSNIETACCKEDCKLILGLIKCEYEAQCINGISNISQGDCICDDGWFGHRCNISSQECSSSMCSGAGFCFEKKDQKSKEDILYCDCQDGFTGEKCENLQCNLDCGVNGICSGGQCRCFEGWTGISCNKSKSISSETICLEPFMSEQGTSVLGGNTTSLFIQLKVFALMTVVTMLTADKGNVSVMKDGKENSARGDHVTPGVTIMATVMMGPVCVTRAGRGLTALWMGVLMPAVDMASVSKVLVLTHLYHGPADVTMDGLDKTAT